MNLLQKAFFCSCNYFDGQDVFYGETRSKAKSKAVIAWSDTINVPYIEIKAIRAKHLDLIENTPDPLLKNLSKSQVAKMLHMTGLSKGREQYRNYYTSFNPVEDLESLIKIGLATSFNEFDSIVYSLTEKGLGVIKSTIPLLRKQVA